MAKSKILVACEESQVVTQAFRDLGYEAYSCDIVDCSGGHPEWHLKCDVRDLLTEQYDLVIAHPPCTDLSCSGAKHFAEKIKDGRQPIAVAFFMLMTQFKSPRICIENPIGIMSTRYRKPDQIIHPYMFGDPAKKSTCLWLKGLPKLVPTNIVGVLPDKVFPSGKRMSAWYYATRGSKKRSKTFPGFAKQMAEQWGKLL